MGGFEAAAARMAARRYRRRNPHDARELGACSDPLNRVGAFPIHRDAPPVYCQGAACTE